MVDSTPQPYTFRIQSPGQADLEIHVEIDPTVPLMENFIQIVEESQGTDAQIDITKEDNGQVIDIPWQFSMRDVGEDGQDFFDELDESRSLLEQNAYPGSEITVSDLTIVGAPDMDRVRHDKKAFYLFVEKNAKYLKVTKWLAASVDITVKNVPGITRVDGDGNPIVEDEHKLRLVLPPDYPYEGPMLVPVSDMWHPNICVQGAQATVCAWEAYDPSWKDTWSYMLRQFVEIIQYRQYNLEEPHRRQNIKASEWFEKKQKQGELEVPLKPMVKFI